MAPIDKILAEIAATLAETRKSPKASETAAGPQIPPRPRRRARERRRRGYGRFACTIRLR